MTLASALLLALLGAARAQTGGMVTHPDARVTGPDLEWDLSATDAAACRDACAAAPACCAYTYQRFCRLKLASPSLAFSKDALSGVKDSCAGTQAPISPAEKLKDPAWRITELLPKSHAWWLSFPVPPFEELARPPEQPLVEYVQTVNALQGVSERTVSVRPAPGYAEDMRAALAGIPDVVKERVAKKLRAVLMVAELGSTGMTDMAIDERGRAASAFIFIDVTRTDMKANAWATSKEASPFKPDGAHGLEAVIEDAEGDTRTNAIQAILLHEFGHVLAAGEDLHPDWDAPPAGKRAKDYPFLALTWDIDGQGRYVSRHAALFADLPPLRFYRQSESGLSASAMADVYARLSSTTFPTLYAATNPYDDFAESFSNYVRVVLMNRPYRILIKKDGRTVKEYGPCWEEPRCAAKRRFIESFLAGKPAPSPKEKPRAKPK